jgi:glycerol-3-phosphate acyltransferase PlsY
MTIVAFIIAYLIGSIPFGLILATLFGYGDIRATGSGNIGATNVLRAGGKKLAIATLLADMAKGLLPVLIGSRYGMEAALLAGLGAFLGHLFSLWLGFKGGKGVATYVGVLFGLYWPFGLAFALIWLGTAYLFRISSLAALVATAAIPLVVATTGNQPFVFVILIITALIFFKHRDNIKRLLAGEEDKIGSKGA